MVRLRRWYMDVVTPDGVAWVGYAARVWVGGIPFGCAGWLRGGTGPRASKHRVRLRVALPAVDGEELSWHPRGLGASGTWSPHGSSAPRALGAGGPTLRWNARATSADARARALARRVGGVHGTTG